MSDAVFAAIPEKVLSLSYEQTIVLMEKMLENLRGKISDTESVSSYEKMEQIVSNHTMNSMWKELTYGEPAGV